MGGSKLGFRLGCAILFSHSSWFPRTFTRGSEYVYLASEGFGTAGQGTEEGLDSGVDSLVTRQLLVPSEGFAAGWVGAVERSLSYTDSESSGEQ